MPNLNDFYAFKITTSGGNQTSGSNGSIGYSGTFVILMIISAVLCFIGKVS